MDFIDYENADYKAWYASLSDEDKALVVPIPFDRIGELNNKQLERRIELRKQFLQDQQRKAITDLKNNPKQATDQKTAGEIAENNLEEKPADMLYNLARSEITEMFRDEELQTPYALLTVDGVKHILNMESEQFKLKLRILYENHIAALPDTDQSPIISEQDLNKVIQQLLARNDTYRKLSLRCFFDGSVINYDFMNKENQYAVITPEGYTIKDDAYHLFKKFDDYHAQTLPDQQSTDGGALLDSVIKSFKLIDNEHGDKNLLYKVGLMSLFFRAQTRITMPIWTVNGPPGASKSSLLLFLKFLTDPINGNPKAMVNRWGREDQTRDRGLVVSQNYFVIFDNLSHINEDESDELCIYSTGGRWQERKMRTNVDTIWYELQGNVGYTSINDIAKKSDLISRQLKFELDIRTSNLSESVFWSMREKEKPAILHYIFSTIGRAIPIYNKLSSDPSNTTGHRLADFILLCEAISQAIGEPEGRIRELFGRVEQEQAERSIDNSTFATFFAEYVLNTLIPEKGKEMSIVAKEIFDGLKGHASATGYDTFTDVDFPKNVKQLGFKVERIRSALQKFNIDIRKGERSSQGNTYRIRYIEPSQTTPSQQVKIEQCVTALKETIELVKDNAQTLELFACPYCDHNSNTLEILERHAIKAHPNKPFADDYDKQTRRKTAEA